MQSPITNRDFLLEQAQEVLRRITEGASDGGVEPGAALESVGASEPDAAISRFLAQAIEDEFKTAPAGSALESLSGGAPAQPYLPANQTLAMLQSAYDEYHEGLAELERPFGTTDPGWVTVAVERLRALLRGNRPFIAHRRLNDFQADLPEEAVVALYSDWGTGEPSARRVMEQIRLCNPTHAIHLGDVYYSGTKRECENRFLRVIEELGPPVASCRHFALNSNHEMYSGGYGYFDVTLARFGQPASYFNLRNRHWNLIGLDSGYEDFGLKEPQREWLQAQLAGEGRSILLSHHQPFSAYEGRAQNRKLFQKTADLLPQVFAWFWGHEHKCIVYRDHMGIKGRCIGHGAIPEGVPFGAPGNGAPVMVVDDRADGDGMNLHGFALLRLAGEELEVSYIDEFGGLFFQERFTARGETESVSIPGPRRVESPEAPGRRAVAEHYRHLLSGRDGGGGLESMAEGPAEPDLSPAGIRNRVRTTQEQLHDIVRQFLDDDSSLHEIADRIAADGGPALERLEGEAPEDLDTEALSGALEVIVRTDGSRPSFMVQNGKVNLHTSPAGIWADQITASEAEGSLLSALQCVGRIDVPGSIQGFEGTGFLVAENVIMTNRHVLQAVARPDPQGVWAFKPGVSIDFGHEFRAVDSLSPRQLQKVLYAAARPIAGPIDHSRLDLVLIEIGPADNGARPSAVLAVDIASDWDNPPEIIYTVGYPGNPGARESLTLQEQLFQKTFGCKRLAPGEIMRSSGTLFPWTTAHDASTLGGNSGSVVLSAGREGAAAALHYGGTRANPRENWSHVLGRVLAEPDKLTGKPLLEVLQAIGVQTVDRHLRRGHGANG